MKQNKYSNNGPPEKNLNFSQMPKQTPKQQKEQELKKQLDEYNKKKLQQGRQDWQEANDANTLDQRNILQGMWNIAQFVDPGISTNIANIGINKLRGTPQEGGDYAGILASLIPYTKYGMKGEKLGKPWIKKLLEYTDKGEDAYNIAAQQYGGEANWLDQYDEGGPTEGKKDPGTKTKRNFKIVDDPNDPAYKDFLIRKGLYEHSTIPNIHLRRNSFWRLNTQKPFDMADFKEDYDVDRIKRNKSYTDESYGPHGSKVNQRNYTPEEFNRLLRGQAVSESEYNKELVEKYPPASYQFLETYKHYPYDTYYATNKDRTKYTKPTTRVIEDKIDRKALKEVYPELTDKDINNYLKTVNQSPDFITNVRDANGSREYLYNFEKRYTDADRPPETYTKDGIVGYLPEEVQAYITKDKYYLPVYNKPEDEYFLRKGNIDYLEPGKAELQDMNVEDAPFNLNFKKPLDYAKRQWDFSGATRAMRYYDKSGKLLYSDIPYGSSTSKEYPPQVQRFYESNYEREKTPMNMPYAEWEKSFQKEEGGPTEDKKESPKTEKKVSSEVDYADEVSRISDLLESERGRVSKVRKNVIPSAQALDKADSELRTKYPEAYEIFQQSKLAKTPEELRKIIKKYPESLKNVLPNQGNYNLLLSNPNKYTADDEIYCTPYGCFTYQKAGAKDVPMLSGNFGFVEGAAKGTIPFQEVPSSQAEPGDMAIIYGQTMMDYRDPSKGYGDRPHHTTIYAGNMKKDPKGNVTAYDMYNAHEGNRLFFQKETRDKASNKDSGYKFYRYTGKVPEYEKQLQEARSNLVRNMNMAPRQVGFPQDEPELEPSSYLQSLPSQEYGGWLDELDEYKRGGQKGLRKFTSKNIQSSINTLFARNYDLFGPSGKKYYSPLVKYFNGGFNQENALPEAIQSTDWSMMANPNAVDYRTQAYPNASNPTMMQGPAAPTVTDKLTPEMGLDYKQKFDNPLFGDGKFANLTRGLIPWVTQLGNQDDYKAMQDKAFASTNANAVFRKDDQKNLGTHTMDTYGIDTMRPNQVGMKVFGQGLAYENQNISKYGGESGWLDNY